MKKWYSLIPDGSIDYAIRNNKTGEIEAIFAKVATSGIKYRRYLKDATGEWVPAKYAVGFPSLKSVKEYYDNHVNH